MINKIKIQSIIALICVYKKNILMEFYNITYDPKKIPCKSIKI